MTVPSQRLTAVDVYHYLDWLEEALKRPGDLMEVERAGRLRLVFTLDYQFKRLEQVLAHMPDPRHSDAMECIAELKRVRFNESLNWAPTLVRLRSIVAAWDRDRPRYVCDHAYTDDVRCGVTARSPEKIAEHRYHVHNGPEPDHWREESAA